MKRASNDETFYAVYETEKGAIVVKYSIITPICIKLTTLIDLKTKTHDFKLPINNPRKETKQNKKKNPK